MAPCVLLLVNMGSITPSYSGLELPWRTGWLWQLLVDLPETSKYLEASHREVSCQRSYGAMLLMI